MFMTFYQSKLLSWSSKYMASLYQSCKNLFVIKVILQWWHKYTNLVIILYHCGIDLIMKSFGGRFNELLLVTIILSVCNFIIDMRFLHYNLCIPRISIIHIYASCLNCESCIHEIFLYSIWEHSNETKIEKRWKEFDSL